MNTTTKRIAQMAALYAAKKLWSQVDKEAAREMMGQLYRSAPQEWEAAARRAAGEGFDNVRTQATRSMDDVLDQIGLMRRSQVPTRSMSSMAMGFAGGVALTAAGGYFLYGTETGKTLRRRFEESLAKSEGDVEEALHSMSGDEVILNPDAAVGSVNAHAKVPSGSAVPS